MKYSPISADILQSPLRLISPIDPAIGDDEQTSTNAAIVVSTSFVIWLLDRGKVCEGDKGGGYLKSKEFFPWHFSKKIKEIWASGLVLSKQIYFSFLMEYLYLFCIMEFLLECMLERKRKKVRGKNWEGRWCEEYHLCHCFLRWNACNSMCWLRSRRSLISFLALQRDH